MRWYSLQQAVQRGNDSGFQTAVGCQLFNRKDDLPAGAVEHHHVGVGASSVNADPVVLHPLWDPSRVLKEFFGKKGSRGTARCDSPSGGIPRLGNTSFHVLVIDQRKGKS